MFSSLTMPIFTTLQSNAQGINSHGIELIQFVNDNTNTFHVLYIQETWYQEENILQFPNYTCLSKNRTTQTRG